ncbi:hypothetical protein ACWD01_36025 [Streptomyces sp. NPDC002835]
MASPLPPRLTPRERARRRTNLVLTGTLFGLTRLGMLGFAALAVVGNLDAEELVDTDGWVGCTVCPYGTVGPVPSLG